MTIQSNWWFQPVPPANVPTPTGSYLAFFVSDGSSGTTANALYKKDSAGVLTPLIPAAYTDEQAQDAVGNILTDTATINFTYNDGANTIIADVQGLTSVNISDFVEAAQDAVGGALLDSSTIDFTYSDAGNTITGIVIDGSITNAKLANMPTQTFRGRTTAGTGPPEDLTATQATAILNLSTIALKGLQSATDKLKEDNMYKDIVSDFGADPLGSVDATTIIQTAVDSFPASGGRLYFPAGTYKISGVITVSKPVIIIGAGRSISAISTTAATGNMFTMATGAAGAGFEQIRLIGATAGTRTAGFAVDFANISNTYMQQCDILFQHSGVRSAGALQFLDDLNIREGGANAASGQGILVDSTGDRYIRRITMDQGSNPSGYAGIRIRQCSSCVITDSNLIHCNTCLDIVPNGGGGTAAASIYAVSTFFDTSNIGLNVLPATASDTAQRMTFVRCWFGTMATSGVVLGNGTIPNANMDSIDFIGCEFYQSVIGIDAKGVAEWAVRASRFAGNSNAGIRTAQGASASTHSFTISDNTIGNVAGFGVNGLGINIQAGTYRRYQILDNRGLDTNTTKGITDAGVVGAADQKQVAGNLGHNTFSSLIGADANFTTTEVVLCELRVPAGVRQIGESWLVRIAGTGPIAAGAITPRIKVGAASGIGGTSLLAIPAITGVVTGRWGIDAVVTMKTATSVRCEGYAYSNTAITHPAAGAPPAATAVTTTADWFITVTGQMSTSTSTATSGGIVPL